MDIIKIQTLIKQGKVVSLSDLDPNEAYLQIGVYQPGNRKIGPADANTYAPFVIPLSQLGGGGGGVWGSITGLLSNQLDLQAALDAKYDASNPSGYLTSINGPQVETALGYTPYDSTNPDGYITGITSSDVTTALGFTPTISTITVTVDLNSIAPQVFAFPTGKFIPYDGYLSNATIDTTVSLASNLQVYNAGNIFCQSEQYPPCGPGPCDDAFKYLFVPANYYKLYFGGFSCFPPPCNGQYIINGGSDLTIQLATASGTAGTVDVHIMVYQIN